MIEIPIHFLIYSGCLFFAVSMTWRRGIRHGISLTLNQLAEDGILSFEDE